MEENIILNGDFSLRIGNLRTIDVEEVDMERRSKDRVIDGRILQNRYRRKDDIF